MSLQRRFLPIACALLILAGTLASLTNSVVAAIPTWPDPAPLQETLNNIVNNDGALGVSAEVRDTYRGTFTGTAGKNDTAGNPIDSNTHFLIGSDSKLFVAIAILQQQAAGKLSLDDKLDKFFAHGIVPNSDQITVRMLLTHTSGTYNYTGDATFVQQLRDDPTHSWTPEQLIQLAAQHPANAPAGSAYSYSNTNYLLAAMIIEKLTGQFYGNAIQSGILTPLGLSETSVPLTNNMPAPFMHGYADLSLSGNGSQIVDMSTQSPTFWYGAGQMVSTQHDMNDFYTALFSGQLLNASQMTLLKTVVPQSANTINNYYGLGIARYELRCGVTVWGHNGSVPGYQGSTFISDNGQRVYTMMYTAAQDNNDAPYNKMLDAVFCKVPLISTDNPADGPSYFTIGRLTHIFTRSSTGSLIWARQQQTGGSWERIDLGGNIISNPVAASDSYAHLRIFAQGANNHLMMTETNGVWVDSGITIDMAPSVVVTEAGRYDLFARASDKNHLLHIIFDGTNWQSETINVAAGMASSPVVYSDHPGNFYVFYKRSDNKLGQAWTDATGIWRSTTIGTTQISTTPAVTSSGPGNVDVFARGTNTHLMRANYSTAKGWVWTDLGGVITTASAIFQYKIGDIHIFAVGTDKAVYERTLTANWVSHSPSLIAAPGAAVTSPPVNRPQGGYQGHIVAMGTDTYLYEQTSNGTSWTGWSRVISPAKR